MKHQFQASTIAGAEEMCRVCHLDMVSHTDSATCSRCEKVSVCELFPSVSDPKRQLLCAVCISEEYLAANELAEQKKLASEKRDMTLVTIGSAGAYFAADIDKIPPVKEINDIVQADASIPADRKNYEILRRTKERILNLQEKVVNATKDIREWQRDENELRLYLSHKQKEISLDEQKKLGLDKPVDYKPTKAAKPTSAPSVRGTNLDEMKKYANQFGIPLQALRILVVRRNLSIADAAKEFIKGKNVAEGATRTS